MPYERVLSGPEGRLLYGPEFSDGEYVFGDDVFGDDVFGDDVFFLGIQISDTRAPNRSAGGV